MATSVALARRDGREFIDAKVSNARTSYEVTADLDEQAILRTARESEFRRHSGFREAMPEVRFALTDIDAYGELYAAVRAHAVEMAERGGGRIVPWAEVARDWYATDYLPTIADARATIGQLIDDCSDADVYIAIHRRRLAWWGSECDAVDCAAQQVLAERQIDAARSRSLLSGVLGRRNGGTPAATVLPLSEIGEH